MGLPPGAIEVFLQPGEHYFSDSATRIRTILGSCVAITLWHPKLLLGGMCHIMLPSRSASKGTFEVSAKYADEALDLLLSDIKKAKTNYHEYQVKIFGGGDMFSSQHEDNHITIGEKNIEMVKALLKKYGLKTHAEHLGGHGHRYIIFDVWSGYVWMKHQTLAHSEPSPSSKQSKRVEYAEN